MKSLKKYSFLLLLALLVSVSPLSAKAKKSSKSKGVPQSIVALSPASAEILFAVGAGKQVSAVSDYTDYPAEAAAKPKVGGFDGKTLSLESILSFEPDMVYLTDGMHNFLIEQLDQIGIKYYLSKAGSIADVEKEILEVGELTGHAKEAKAVVESMKGKMTFMKSTSEKPSLYYEVWNAPYMSAGSQSFINDVIARAGAVNIFADVDEAYPMVSEESIIARQPEIIVLPASSGVTADAVKNRSGWSSIPAVKNNKIFIIDDNVFTRPGPRIADAVQDLAALVQ